jgi:2-polyprenyl-6-methoxyphenol hydroxylase-like FAD-dependent oxidoreductase
MTEERVLIIGGGIGGLTLANALRAVDVPFTVFERDDDLREIGAGIAIRIGVQRALAEIGLEQQVQAILGDPLDCIELTSKRGRVLARIPQMNASRGAHRGIVLNVLKAGIDVASCVQCDRQCVGFEQDAGGVTARFADGSEERGAVLVGADGLQSTIRQQVLGDGGPRYAGYLMWRALPEFPKLAGTHKAVEALGPGGVFGMIPAKMGRVYWFGSMAMPEGKPEPPAGRKAEALEAFRGWAEPIEELIAATPDEIIVRQGVYDRDPADHWSDGRVTLLGDAAHPTTPVRGMGAGMAIQDAPVLARALAAADLADTADVQRALKLYEAERLPPTAATIRASWRMSHVICWKRQPAMALRSTVLKLIPTRVFENVIRRELEAASAPLRPLTPAEAT